MATDSGGFGVYAVWTKWNGGRSRRVDFIAGEESQSSPACVVRVGTACGMQWAWRITAGLCHAFP